MIRKIPYLFLAPALLLASILCATPAAAQNQTCPTVANGDSTNKCASTAFVQKAISGGGASPENRNTVFAGPASGPASSPTFRLLVPQDIPTLACDQASTKGFIGDGVTNNDSAWSSWKAALPASGGCLEFGLGTFLFNSQATYTFGNAATGPSNNKNSFSHITIKGVGRDLTTLYWPNVSGGFQFNAQSFQHTIDLQNSFSIATGQAGGGTCVGITNTFAFFGEFNAKHHVGVTCRGFDGYGASDYWSAGVSASNASNLDFYGFHYEGSTAATSDITKGIGIDLISSTSPGTGTCTQPGCATIYNIMGAKIDFAGRGIRQGTQVQAVNVGAGTAILNGCRGIEVASGATQVRQLSVVGAQISVNCDQIFAASAISGSVISGNYLGVANGFNGIVLATDAGIANSGGNIITNNTFVPLSGAPSDCIFVATATAPVYIGENIFNSCNTGVEATAASANVMVGPNQYIGVTNRVLDSGTGNVISSVIPFTAQGDLLYGNASAQTPMTRLPKSTTATRYLANTGTSNNPNWDQVNLANGVIGSLPNANLANPATTVAGQTCTLGSTCGLSSISNALGSDVSLNNVSNFFDGPSVAQGTTGTWFASGHVTLQDTAGAAAMVCKLWDGTTVIASNIFTDIAATDAIQISLSGFLASPAANIKISCQDQSSTSGKIKFNLSGASKDSILYAFRIN